jgi:hypothetical protein
MSETKDNHIPHILAEKMNSINPTWKNTIKGDQLSSPASAGDMAEILGYDYFVWRGRIYPHDAFDQKSFISSATLKPEELGSEIDLG